MSAAVFCLICLSAGFYAGSKWKVSKVFVSKDPGHPLYFLSALIAAVLFVFALAIDSAFQALAAYDALADIARGTVGQMVPPNRLDHATRLSVLTCWVVIVGFCLPRLLNWPLNSNESLLDQIADRSGEREAIDDVVRDSLKMQIPLAVTVDDDKVYVGFPISGEPFGIASARWLRLRPMFSGFRDSQREMQLTTDYQGVISALRQDDRLDPVAQRAFDVVLPFDRLTSVHPFDLKSYRNYFTGNTWSETEQFRRIQELAEIAAESAPNPVHRRDYWAFVGLVGAAPILWVSFSHVVSALALFLALALGYQAARPADEVQATL